MPTNPARPGDIPCHPFKPTRRQRLFLAFEVGGMDERTIVAAYANPQRVRESTLARLKIAAKNLNIPAPCEVVSIHEESRE